MKTIEEIMKLVDAYGDACETFGDYQVHANAMECVAAKAAIESSLRELVEQTFHQGFEDGCESMEEDQSWS